MSRPGRYPLFQALGVELEYMIVHSRSLDVAPIADQVLHAVSGGYEAEIEMGELAWSNELALHVIELKSNGPVRTLSGLTGAFERDLRRIQDILDPLNARLMPTAVHPWMDPHTETRLWPHEQNAIYESFDRIFSCRGHGWSNLQCVHVNLSFANDEEFGRLHAAVRVLLPIMPALAASSPYLDAKWTGRMDARLDTYRHNADRIPSVAGHVIPEREYTKEAYRRNILDRIYRDIAPYDPGGELRHEWVNARGAIARFDRNTIEIRMLDIQECPAADIAIVHIIIESLKLLCSERWMALDKLMAWDERDLESMLLNTISDGEAANITLPGYLKVFGMEAEGGTAGDIWRHLATQIEEPEEAAVAEALEFILRHGTLARRLLNEIGETPSRNLLHGIYSRLCDHLLKGRLYGECV